MYRYMKAVIIVGILAMALGLACSDRGTNVPTRDDTTGWTFVDRENPVFVANSDNPSPQLMFQRNNADGLLPMAVYVPKVALPPASAEVPLLLILAPQEGNQFYYFQHGLGKLCNEMISNGEIIPMIVACVGNDDKFGGYFYGNSYPGGFYDEVLGKELIKDLQFRYPMLIPTANRRAISGMGQGAYGALRAAIQHPEVFSAVSVVDGPLDFDGESGQGGFIRLFRPALDEQVGKYDFFLPWIDTTVTETIDTTVVPPVTRYDTTIADRGVRIDTARATREITRMFIGGSIAFSPHDTLLDYTGSRSQSNLMLNARYVVRDSSTLIGNLLTGRVSGGPIRRTEPVQFAFHIPFNNNANADVPTWQRWMDNNLENLYNKQGNPLADVSVWMGTSAQADRMTYHEQTVSFKNFLESKGIEPTMYQYSGYSGDPATDGQYTYYLLREILKFHSEQFKKN